MRPAGTVRCPPSWLNLKGAVAGWQGGGGGVGPDQQYGAGGVVDDEAAGGAEAVGPS